MNGRGHPDERTNEGPVETESNDGHDGPKGARSEDE